MENFIIVAVVALILGCAGWYIRKSKKAGANCIGCPDSGTCGSCSGCGGGDGSPCGGCSK